MKDDSLIFKFSIIMVFTTSETRCANLTHNDHVIIPLDHRVFVDDIISVRCLPNMRFFDGTHSKTLTCLRNGEWDRPMSNCSCKYLFHLISDETFTIFF